MSDKFTHYDLSECRGGEIIEITVSGSTANVRLMDSSNFQSYRSNRRYRYAGGVVQLSHVPVLLQVPHTGRWHVIIDLRGLREMWELWGNLRSTIRMVPGPLLPIRGAQIQSDTVSDGLVHEIWIDEEGPACIDAGPRGDGARAFLGPNARLVHVFTARSIVETLNIYRACCGWWPYTTIYAEDFEPYPPEDYQEQEAAAHEWRAFHARLLPPEPDWI